MRTKIRTSPDWSAGVPEHQEALANGNDHFRAWSQNVEDRFKGKSNEEIRETLQQTANPFAVCFEHWIGDFNMGTGIRNANAFNAKEVFYIGDKRWDRRAAVGVHNYTDVQWVPTVNDFLSLKDRYTFIGVDNVPGSVPLYNFQWPRNAIMIFGEEGVGLTPEMQKRCDAIVAIEMFGSVRSLNCGVASGIVMFDYLCKWRVTKEWMEMKV